MYLLEVALPLPLFKTFHYLSEKLVFSGTRVIIPFGSQKLVGIILNCKEVSQEDLDSKINYKEIEEVLEEYPLYPPKLFPFLEWVSHYYHCPLGIVLKIALPSGIFKIPTRRLFLTEKGKRALKDKILPDVFIEIGPKGVSLQNFLKKTKISSKKVKEWIRLGFLEIKTEFPRAKIPVEIFYRLVKEPPKEFEIKLKELFKESEEILEKILKERLKGKEIQKLLSLGILAKVEYPKMRRLTLPVENLKDYELTFAQKEVLKTLLSYYKEGGFKPFLLFGVTGSGKSLIYLELVKRVLEEGKKVLFLLPEIALTHYVEKLLYQHFKDKIALLHSALSPQQRLSEWVKILEGKAYLVIGTRSAIFAPVDNLGAIIVDEEHDPSYKEENLPCRYQARDLALIRGKIEGTLVLLGSATPSIKSYFWALKGKYQLLTLKERPFVKMPEVKLVENQKFIGISKEVIEEIKKSLLKGDSVFIYLNRRGFAPLVKCSDCSYIVSCPNCGIPMTYHKERNLITCHYCSFEISAQILCPQCKRGQWIFLKMGTERVEEELKKLFPGVEVLRWDRDSTNTEKTFKELLEKVYLSQPKIIVGTQMGVHGHNFPQVNLVVVLKAEEGLFLPHYKANERTFQLLLQAEGRAGRKEEQGKVLIQTAFPDLPVIQYALAQDYEGFFREEILKRKKYRFPPFVKLAVIRLIGISQERIIQKSPLLKERLERTAQEKELSVEILGPSPCPLQKLRGLYRWQILLKSEKTSHLHSILLPLRDIKFPGIKIEIDIDPEDLL